MLCHIVVGIFVVVGAMVVWLFHRPVRTFTVAGAVGVVGALLTAFWAVPLVATFAYTANMRYEKLTWYLDYLFPAELWWVYALAAIGVVVALVRRDRAVLTLVALTGAFALIFRVWPELHAWNLRFLPFWYLGLFLLAAAGVAELVRGIGQQVALVWLGAPPELGDDWGLDPVVDGRRFRLVKSTVTMALVLALAVGGLVYAHHDAGFLDFWAQWNYSGYQDTSPTSTKPKPYGEYRDLMNQMGRLPAGRAMWEGGQAIDTYGTSLALMLLPYWTDGRIASMEGLYYESSATTPFHFMAVAPLSGPGNASNPVRGLDYRTIDDFDLGVRYMQLLGVRYYMAYSTEAKSHAEHEPAARAGRAGPRPGQGPAARVEHLPGEGRGDRRPARVRAGRRDAARRDPVEVLRAPARCGARRTRSSARGSAWRRGGGTTRAPWTARSPRADLRAGPGCPRRPRRPQRAAGSRP